MGEPTIIHVVGNRPQFIKLAVLHQEIARKTGCKQIIVHTGQHASVQMSDIFFDELSIPRPDLSLDLPGSHAFQFIGLASEAIAGFLAGTRVNDLVLVYGDTNSTLAAALAARRSGRTLLHFESGVRTDDTSMPEEVNRVLTDRLADVHYCCTERNLENLKREGFGSAISAELLLTGDLMLDAFLMIKASEQPVTTARQYIACTIHRAANIGSRENLSAIVQALNKIHHQSEVVIPLHPHTAKRLAAFDIRLQCTTLQPLGYKQMKRLLQDADAVITDSGGACREAYFSEKKSLIIMKYPFWPEIIDAGAALQASANEEDILVRWQQIQALRPSFDEKIFGDGSAAGRIAAHIGSLIR